MNKPILIQGAMNVETDWMVSQLEEVNYINIAGYHFWQGTVQGKPVVIGRTDIGTISCSGATALGISTFQPEFVLNQGIAGGHRADLSVGDMVIGARCIHINNLKTTAKPKGAGFDATTWSYHITDDNQTEPTVYHGDSQLVKQFDQAKYQGKKLVGCLGSGDIFNLEQDRILWTRSWANSDCEDMESIAAYEICARFQVPCLGLRILSNNELTGESYQRGVGEVLQQFVWKVLFG